MAVVETAARIACAPARGSRKRCALVRPVAGAHDAHLGGHLDLVADDGAARVQVLVPVQPEALSVDLSAHGVHVSRCAVLAGAGLDLEVEIVGDAVELETAANEEVLVAGLDSRALELGARERATSRNSAERTCASRSTESVSMLARSTQTCTLESHGSARSRNKVPPQLRN